MLRFSWETVRLFVHIVAATIWVGGQLTLAALVPTLRALGSEAPGAVARRFNQVAWPAFAVLVLTGIWNIAAEAAKQSHPGYQATLGTKMVLVLLSGLSAFLHTRARSRTGLAVWGAVAGLSALGATLFAVLLAGWRRLSPAAAPPGGAA
jgi:putative copper export protein